MQLDLLNESNVGCWLIASTSKTLIDNQEFRITFLNAELYMYNPHTSSHIGLILYNLQHKIMCNGHIWNY